MIKKADILLLIAILILGLALSFFSLKTDTAGDIVVVSVDGKVYGTYDLASDQTIHIEQGDHVNDITIKDGHVQMEFSSCQNQICVHTGEISTIGKKIVCLPNRVMVEVKEKKGGSYDVLSE